MDWAVRNRPFLYACIWPGIPVRRRRWQPSFDPAQIERPVFAAATATCRHSAAIRLLRFIAEKRSLVFAVGSLHQRRRQQHELSALKLDMHRVPNQGGRQLKIGGSSVE
jgi:hypothetical protein